MRAFNQFVVIIPCYEPSKKKFVPYIAELCAAGVEHIVIVNDGSGEQYECVFDEIRELAGDRVQYISYAENVGKGYALKKAFAYCKENFSADYAFVTADCDGQHLVEDVLHIGEEALAHREALILGSRDFSLPQVPKRSRSGNTKTSALLKFFYGVKIKDTQTGLRGFSYALLDKLTAISGNRFEYETNQIISLHHKKIEIREVPIQTVYEEKAEDVEKISHFKTFHDSVRVIGVLLKNLGWYFFSSALSAIIDVVAFALLFSCILSFSSLTVQTLVATVTARVLSSIVNFTCNYKLVFHGSDKRCIFRYYTLWLLQLSASFGLARLWAAITEISLLVSLFKAISDILLSVLSYQIQCNWVFASRPSKEKFFGGFSRFTRRVLRLFAKKYDASEVTYQGEGCVLICRHLNMHGCYTAVRSLDFDAHILAYHVFFSYKDAFRQYSTITFAKNGRTLGSKIKAFFPAIFVPKLLKSAKAIPVYRGGAASFKTIKMATDSLLKGENVILFPDMDYKASQEQESEIYKGFLWIEKYYYKACKQHIKFVPLTIDDERRKISAQPPISFADGDFKAQMEEIAAQIKAGIQKK